MVYNTVNADLGHAEGGVLNHNTVTSMLTAVIDGDAATSSAEAENAEAAGNEQTMLSDIIQGYTTDHWFADANHTAELELWHGLYYKGDALVVPDLPNLKGAILEKLHDPNYAYWLPLDHLHRTTHVLVAWNGNRDT